jgi:predicted transcriptional regulator
MCRCQVANDQSNRFNVLLDDEHAARLHRLADRTYLNPGTLARSLLSTALDQADPDPAAITALLDSIPGAWDRAQEGLGDAAAGRFVPLAEL